MVAIFSNLLTWTLLLPVIGALVTIALPEKVARWAALLFSAGTLGLTLYMFFSVIGTNGLGGFGDLAHPRFAVDVSWIHFQAGNLQFNIDYNLGVDGLSLPLVILNAVLTMLAVGVQRGHSALREITAVPRKFSPSSRPTPTP